MQVLGGGFIDVVARSGGTARAFRGEIAGAGKAEIEHRVAGGLRENIGAVDWPPGQPRIQILARKIQRSRLQRAIAACGLS